MYFAGFKQEDFELFVVEDFETRLIYINNAIHPKLEAIGHIVVPFLMEQFEGEFYYHVAKHRRRRTNPPDETWVSWSTKARSYKSLPHFTVSVDRTGLHVMFELLWEAGDKRVEFAIKLNEVLHQVLEAIPESFVWYFEEGDNIGIHHRDMNIVLFKAMLQELRLDPKSECSCGFSIPKDSPLLENGELLVETIKAVILSLSPLYRIGLTMMV